MSAPSEFTVEAWPKRVRELKPKIGLVLGSGLGSFVDRADVVETVSFDEISGLPESRVPGHAGRFVFARLGNANLLIAQGRVHLYEGHIAAEVAAGVRLMAAAGIGRLVLTNAAGSLNPDFQPGRWMAITDHLNLTGTSPLLGGAHFFDMTEVYSRAWRREFREVADGLGIDLCEGVYAGNLGPQYETPAEVRMARTLGADAVGMSTVLEAIQARALDLEVAGFSCLTNWAAGMGQAEITHEEVLELGNSAAEALAQVLEAALGA